MTTFFFRRSVEKAFQLDEAPSDLSLNLNKPIESNSPYITSAVDDVMYIVDKVLQRSLATSQRSVVAGVVPTVGRVLGSDFVGMIQRKMRDESYPKAVIQGGLPPEDKIVAFLVLINNLDVATEYIARIVSGRVDASTGTTAAGEDDQPAAPLADLYPFEHDAVFVTTALRSLHHSFEGKTTELIADGLYVAFDRVIKPRLRPILADAFRDVDYQLTEEELAQQQLLHGTDGGSGGDVGAASVDAVAQRFQQGWEGLMQPLRRLLTERSYGKLLATTTAYLAGKVLEKRLWGYHGRVGELGAVRLERDVAGVVGAVVRGGRYGLRDAFLRCSQICLVMNMEEDEWEELAGRAGAGEADAAAADVQWRLSADERRRARAMVVPSPGMRPP